jgi:hypothetical protein
MVDIPVLRFQKYWTQKLESLKSDCHAIMKKYPDATSVVQQEYKVFSGTENLVGCTLAKVRESSEWPSVVNSVEEYTANFCKALDGKLLFGMFYSMYMVTLNELKAVPEGECTGRIKCCSEQNLSGIIGPGQLPGRNIH